MKNSLKDIIILGAGMAGFGAAHHFYKNKIRAIVFEKNDYHGGHAATFEKDGFIFDDGPHISFTKNKRIRKLFDDSVNHKVETFTSFVNNYWKGFWIKHPAQINLFGLPPKIVVKIIKEIFEANSNNEKLVSNYKEWLYSTFGKTFSETFPMKYTNKFHTTGAENMDIDWMGPRLYRPNLDEVISGAITMETENVHYVTDFFYPKNGGFVRFLDQFLQQTNLELSHEVTNINPLRKLITFNNERTEEYNYLISSIPLPELIPLINDVPKEVLESSQKLACSSCVCVNIGVTRTNISEAHWTYFYDEDIIFTRLSFPHMFAPGNAPQNCGSIQAEIYFSEKYKPLTKSPNDFISETISDLIRCGVIKETDEIIFKDAKYSPYANVIFDLERIENLSIVHKYLDMIDVKYCGRFGDWGYHWTDDSFLSGEKAAKKVIKQLKVKK